MFSLAESGERREEGVAFVAVAKALKVKLR